MTAPIIQVRVTRIEGDIAYTGTLLRATITRYGRPDRMYWISQSSERRLSYAIYGHAISRWSFYNGWYATLWDPYEVDRMRKYYRSLRKDPQQ